MMTDAQPTDLYYCPPRLGIRHLLLWTAVVAVFLKLHMAADILFAETHAQHLKKDFGLQISQAQFILIRVNWLLHSVTNAAAIVGIAILVRAKIRRSPGRLQPGHWFVLTIGVAGLVMFILNLLYLTYWYVVDGDVFLLGSFASATSWGFLAQTILLMAIYLWATWASRGSKWWQGSFTVLATVNLLRCLPEIPGLMWQLVTRIGLQPPVLPLGRNILAATAMVILLMAIVVDLVGRQARDWLHWVGVAVALSTIALMPAIQWAIQQLF